MLFRSQGAVTSEDIYGLLSEKGQSISLNPRNAFNLSGVLYYVGAGIAFLGVAIFIGQEWDNLPSFVRIFTTLGAGLGLFAAAVILESTKRLDRVPDAFHFLAGLLIPGGIFVTLSELGFRGGHFGPAIIFTVLTFSYFLMYRMYRHNLVLAFAFVYATFAVLLITDALAGNFPPFSLDDFISYRILAIGISYALLGYVFEKSTRAVLSGWLYALGTLAILGSAFALQGWDPNQSGLWELVYIPLIFLLMFLAIILRSRSMLFLPPMFLVADIFKLSDEYFRNTLSWPLLLVLAGFLLIGVGYFTFYLNRKYLNNPSI